MQALGVKKKKKKKVTSWIAPGFLGWSRREKWDARKANFVSQALMKYDCLVVQFTLEKDPIQFSARCPNISTIFNWALPLWLLNFNDFGLGYNSWALLLLAWVFTSMLLRGEWPVLVAYNSGVAWGRALPRGSTKEIAVLSLHVVVYIIKRVPNLVCGDVEP